MMRRNLRLTKQAKKAVIGTTLAAGILISSYGAVLHIVPQAATAPPTPIEEKLPEAEVLSREAVVRVLSKKGEIVGLSGDIDKRLQVDDSKWYGEKSYDISLLGEFKLGIETKDVKVSTTGNTVTLTFPHPKLISVSAPYDEAIIHSEAKGVRKDFTTEEEQAIYRQARKEAVKEIKANEYFAEEAEESIGEILRGLISQVPGVDEIKIEVE